MKYAAYSQSLSENPILKIAQPLFDLEEKK
jgi:hypothetical protein